MLKIADDIKPGDLLQIVNQYNLYEDVIVTNITKTKKTVKVEYRKNGWREGVSKVKKFRKTKEVLAV